MTLLLLNKEDIEIIDENFPDITKYNKLQIESCINLKSITLLPNIEKIFISNCPNLQLLINNLDYIKIIKLINCYNLKILPSKLTSLKYLELHDSFIKKIPKTYTNLETLIIKYNKNKKHQIKELPIFNNLITLILENCNQLKKLPDELPKINKIHIISCIHIEEFPDSYITIKDSYLSYSINNLLIKSIKLKSEENYDDYEDD